MSSADPTVRDRPTRRGGELALTLALLADARGGPPAGAAGRAGRARGCSAPCCSRRSCSPPGYVARRFRLPAVAVSLIEAGVWAAFMTVVFLRHTALLWVIPTPETIRAVPGCSSARCQEIVARGRAARRDEGRCRSSSSGSMGLLAIIVDHVVLTARMPLLAVDRHRRGLAHPGDRRAPRCRCARVRLPRRRRSSSSSAPRRGRARQPLERVAERTAGVPATALGIGAIAIIVAVVATPLLPAPAAPVGRLRSRQRDRRDAAARRRPAPARPGRGAARAHRRLRRAVSARHDALAVRRRGVGARPRAHRAARHRSGARAR